MLQYCILTLLSSGCTARLAKSSIDKEMTRIHSTSFVLPFFFFTDFPLTPSLTKVINGRLRSITEKEGGGVQIQGEYGAGESVGELECITASPRPSTLHAIRDTEIARMPKTLFNALSVRHPQITIQISRIIAARVRLQLDQRTTIPAAISGNGLSDMGRNNSNLKVCSPFLSSPGRV